MGNQEPSESSTRYAAALVRHADLAVDKEYLTSLVLQVVNGKEGNDTEQADGEEGAHHGGGEEEEEEEEEEEASWYLDGTGRKRISALKKLWDLTVNSALCNLLDDLDFLMVLETLLLEEEVTYRGQEICFGLLANFASMPSLHGRVFARKVVVKKAGEVIGTCSDPGLLSEVMRLCAVGVTKFDEANGKVYTPSELLLDMLDDDVLLNQILVIWFNTLNAELQLRTSSFLNCLLFFHPSFIDRVTGLHVVPINLYVISTATEGMMRETVMESVRLLHLLSCNEKAGDMIVKEDGFADILLHAFLFTTDDDTATSICEILDNVTPKVEFFDPAKQRRKPKEGEGEEEAKRRQELEMQDHDAFVARLHAFDAFIEKFAVLNGPEIDRVIERCILILNVNVQSPPPDSSVWWMLEVGTRRLYKNWERIVTIGEGRCSCKEDEELLLACTRGLHVLLLHAIPMMEVVEEVSLRIWGTNAEKALVEVCGTLDEVDWEGREVARRVGLPIDEREIRMIVMLLEESLRHVNEVRRNAEE